MTTKEHNQAMECVRQKIHRRYHVDKIHTSKVHHATPNALVRGFMVYTDSIIHDLKSGLEDSIEKGVPLVVPFDAHEKDYRFEVILHNTSGHNSCSKYTYVFNLLNDQGQRV